MTAGRVYLVGAGPGDPGLLTVRGREVLGRADVVVYDALLSERLLDLAPPGAERVYVGKRASAHALPQDEINALLVERARAGRTVVRLKGGDPYVFGRGGEEALALAEANLQFEVVPGVTAGVAAAACAGIPLTHRDLASAVAFVTGHEADDKTGPALDWAALARFPGTLVFYMGVRNLAAICRELAAHGLDPSTPAAAVHWGATPRQKTVAGTLATLSGAAAKADLGPPAIIVVGAVAALRDRLAWFERRPLFGRRIVVTRARRQAPRLAAALEELGAEVLEAPAIRIEPIADGAPLRRAVRRLADYQWIIFTSVNGVDAFRAVLAEAGLDARALAPCQVAAIGPATADRLAAGGVRADLVPGSFTSAALVRALARRVNLQGLSVLCPRADIAPKDLVDALAEAGAAVEDVPAYRTAADDAGGPRLAARLREGGADWITFTSSSTVRNLLESVGDEAVRASGARLASIGPATSGAIRARGLEPAVEADPHTIPGLVEAIVAHEQRRQAVSPPRLRGERRPRST